MTGPEGREGREREAQRREGRGEPGTQTVSEPRTWVGPLLGPRVTQGTLLERGRVTL